MGKSVYTRTALGIYMCNHAGNNLFGPTYMAPRACGDWLMKVDASFYELDLLLSSRIRLIESISEENLQASNKR